MTERSKPTAGPWRDNGCIIEGPKMGLQIAQISYRAAGSNTGFAAQTKSEAFANARLIAEAGTVLHETGLTPRELQKQRDELLAALKPLAGVLITHDGHIIGLMREDFRKARAAIASVEGGVE